jgi:hypothetical protein
MGMLTPFLVANIVQLKHLVRRFVVFLLRHQNVKHQIKRNVIFDIPAKLVNFLIIEIAAYFYAS